MKLNFASGLVLALATVEAVGAHSWFSKAVYDKWHESELERWLSDHDIPYPSPADRKDLESAVKVNWNSKVQKPLGQAADQATDQWHQAKDWIFDTYVQNGRAYYFVHH